jgi:MYXO-CTERM domain-containing protein
MKMNFKLNALAAAVIMAASAPALAAIEGGPGPDGNGELLLNVRYYGGGTEKTGGDDISGIFDLGIRMNDMIALNGQGGVSKSWNLAQGAYGAAWNQVTNFVTSHGGDISNIEFNVIALDFKTPNTPTYLTTFNGETFPGLQNANLRGFQNMQQYIIANADRGTIGTADNGAATATPSDAPNTYFGAIGLGATNTGDQWVGKTFADTTQPLGTAQNFWMLDTNSIANFGQVVKTPFGVDLNHDGSITSNEFSKFTLNTDGSLNFASPVPEADTWAMLLAGLGMLGAMVRRRTGA